MLTPPSGPSRQPGPIRHFKMDTAFPRFHFGFVILLPALLLVVLACGATFTLPTFPSPKPGILVACDMALLSGTLEGDLRDPRLAWVVAPTGKRVDVTWPWGFEAKFEPDVVVMSADASVVIKAGDSVDLGGGFNQETGVFGACEVNGRLFLPSPNPP